MKLTKFLKNNQDMTHAILKDETERRKLATVFKVTPEKLYLIAGLCVDYSFVPTKHPKMTFKTRFGVWDGVSIAVTVLMLVAALGSL